MLFHQFLSVVLAVYAAYYLLLITFDKLTNGAVENQVSNTNELVYTPAIAPINVLEKASFKSEEDSAAGSVNERGGNENMSDDRSQADNNSEFHDLRLEMIAAPSGIPVGSEAFTDWLCQK